MARVYLQAVEKRFGRVEVVRKLDLEVKDQEFLTLLGPSGCGKSTVLNMVAGLETPSSGDVYIGERKVTSLEAHERDVAMVFQSYALYPHKTVFENIAFPLKLRHVPPGEREARVKEVASRLGVGEFLDRRPAELSGGQRQRVALGRALVRRPSVFLLDEPLSNLDAQLRSETRAELKRLHSDFGTTTLYVTHDQLEAMSLSDRIAVMRAGELHQVGTPEEIYRLPANRFVASFVGNPGMNFIRARIEGGRVQFPGYELVLSGELKRRAESLRVFEVLVGIRPEDIEVGAPQRANAEVYAVEPLGSDVLLVLRWAGARLIVRAPGSFRAGPGDSVPFRLIPGRALFFDPGTGRRLPLDPF